MLAQPCVGAHAHAAPRADTNFSSERLHDIYSSDLVNTVGNCASRVTAMIGKYCDGLAPSDRDSAGAFIAVGAAAAPVDWPRCSAAAAATSLAAYEALDLATAARTAIRLVTDVDVYIQATEPFKLAKEPGRGAELGAILYQCLEAVRIAGVLLEPLMPSKMAELAGALGGVEGTIAERAAWGGLRPGTPLPKLALFPRADSPDAPPAAAPQPPKPAKKQKANKTAE